MFQIQQRIQVTQQAKSSSLDFNLLGAATAHLEGIDIPWAGTAYSRPKPHDAQVDGGVSGFARRAEDEGKRGYKTLERRQGKGVVMLGDVMCLVEITLKYAEYITKMHISIEMYLILDPPVSLALKGTESLKNTNIKQRLVSPYSRRCTESTARGGPASQISCRIASTRVVGRNAPSGNELVGAANSWHRDK
ncbi:predicted protein [Histoplasma capsulatum G186AR]|uniref:Uncharacterized protein n=1 Tax=Ajellomyces capsulatus (strain G186AR / H82 / ATCC MYA-2454 / RMSCC 2432) TaxID=447093 RepID=C0NPF7_AJECG|nr:uncharacterized protein HCBG_05037 [Histoplasma capsulatum G186AR]EEH06817.1 predicted protein [Histoplasma capsulatum G186AR]